MAKEVHKLLLFKAAFCFCVLRGGGLFLPTTVYNSFLASYMLYVLLLSRAVFGFTCLLMQRDAEGKRKRECAAATALWSNILVL